MFESAQRRVAALARDGLKVRRLVAGCHELLSGRGEAAGVALARVTLDQYLELDRKDQGRFFAALLRDFSPDPSDVLAAAQGYAAEPSASTLERVMLATEPPRQELFRRFNRAPGGTATILRMRERLLELARDKAELDAVDWDLRHLLASWFNPGFLDVVRVDWHTPAYVLEQIIAHEAVHEIRGWDDLRRRLASDRRCFAFMHPALRNAPLIFVEVALTNGMSDRIGPLLDVRAPAQDPARATTAVFYSISNCQPGLRGVSLGNFLIKSVVELLSREFPRVRTFCTLSPVPGFVDWLTARLRSPGVDDTEAMRAAMATVSAVLGDDLRAIAADPDTAPARLAPVEAPLLRLCATYLLSRGARGEVVGDPVARFHLHNGAQLERANWQADRSRKGLRDSLGMMVNYTYDPQSIEDNHDRFTEGKVVAARRVRALAMS
jgi:malonyl-CoA decarboxylase